MDDGQFVGVSAPAASAAVRFIDERPVDRVVLLVEGYSRLIEDFRATLPDSVHLTLVAASQPPPRSPSPAPSRLDRIRSAAVTSRTTWSTSRSGVMASVCIGKVRPAAPLPCIRMTAR